MKDKGYGIIGNLSKMRTFAKLSEEEEKEYRKYLKKTDKDTYISYLEWEEDYLKIKPKNEI